MRIYLAGKMRTLAGNNAARFAAKAAELRARGFDVFNPAEQDGEYPETGPDLEARQEVFMRDSMERDCMAVCRSRAIYMQVGWDNNSRGAFAEHAVANAIPIPVLYERDDVGQFTPEYVEKLCRGEITKRVGSVVFQPLMPGVVAVKQHEGYC